MICFNNDDFSKSLPTYFKVDHKSSRSNIENSANNCVSNVGHRHTDAQGETGAYPYRETIEPWKNSF